MAVEPDSRQSWRMSRRESPNGIIYDQGAEFKHLLGSLSRPRHLAGLGNRPPGRPPSQRRRLPLERHRHRAHIAPGQAARVADWSVQYYNDEHLHSRISYRTPKDQVTRYDVEPVAERKRMLAKARQRRRSNRVQAVEPHATCS